MRVISARKMSVAVARCRRSRVPATMTWTPVRVGCSVFLNNRYYDAALSSFSSVDPLVARSGQPYLYAAGNAATLKDPTGKFWECGDDNSACSDEAFLLAASQAAQQQTSALVSDIEESDSADG